ncbi:hypothetical protein [Pseudoxanthomonas wuyuanensis]
MIRSRMMRLTTMIGALTIAGAACAADGATSSGVGVDYSSGKYGGDITTEILSVPISVRTVHGNWSFRASLPWIRVSGDPDVLPTLGTVDNLNPLGRGRSGIIGAPSEEEQAASGTASGMGDLTLGMAYSVPTSGALGLDLGVNAKIATADEDKGLGTGANDYGASIDLYRDFDGTLLFGGIGHMWLGTSEFIDVGNINTGNVGISQRIGRVRAGTMYQHRSATVSSLEPRRELIGFLNLPSARNGRWQLYISRGLSDSSPDWGAGVAISSGR